MNDHEHNDCHYRNGCNDYADNFLAQQISQVSGVSCAGPLA